MQDFQAQVDAILEELEKHFLQTSEKTALSPLHR
jgi:hypothetical protein